MRNRLIARGRCFLALFVFIFFFYLAVLSKLYKCIVVFLVTNGLENIVRVEGEVFFIIFVIIHGNTTIGTTSFVVKIFGDASVFVLILEVFIVGIFFHGSFFVRLFLNILHK